jgi:hypothetical protein
MVWTFGAGSVGSAHALLLITEPNSLLAASIVPELSRDLQQRGACQSFWVTDGRGEQEATLGV